MALQGTLAEFGIDEVLRMLAAGGKKGRLRVTGPSRTGSVWVAGGELTASSIGPTSPGPDHEEVLFQLLRLGEGEFLFHADEEPSSRERSLGVEDALSAASERLTEWREIELVLPSMEHWATGRKKT